MFNVNKVELIGNLGRDPEIRTSQSGKRFATLSIATTERWQSNGQPVERTDWHRITVLSQGLVKILEAHGRKGQLVRVSGKLQHSKYEKDGQTRYATDVVVGNTGEFAILSAKRADAMPAAAHDAQAEQPGEMAPAPSANWKGDDVPF